VLSFALCDCFTPFHKPPLSSPVIHLVSSSNSHKSPTNIRKLESNKLPANLEIAHIALTTHALKSRIAIGKARYFFFLIQLANILNRTQVSLAANESKVDQRQEHDATIDQDGPVHLHGGGIRHGREEYHDVQER